MDTQVNHLVFKFAQKDIQGFLLVGRHGSYADFLYGSTASSNHILALHLQNQGRLDSAKERLTLAKIMLEVYQRPRCLPFDHAGPGSVKLVTASPPQELNLPLICNHTMCPKLRSPNHVGFRRGRKLDFGKFVAGHWNMQSMLHSNMEKQPAQYERQIRPGRVFGKRPSQQQQETLDSLPRNQC